MLQQLSIVTASLLGFTLCLYIHSKKVKQEKIVCLIGEDCNEVVNSPYATTLGIPNERVGMFYYAFIAISYGIVFLFPQLRLPIVDMGMRIITGFAALFSLYLTAIQAVLLKKWCEWCLASGILTLLIFFFVALG